MAPHSSTLAWKIPARTVTSTCPLNPECPLSLAAQLDDATDLLKVLKNGGAHLDFRTRDGLTAVHCATRQRNAAALTVSAGPALAGASCDLGASPMSPALARGFFPSEPPEKPLIYFLKLLPTSIEMLSDFHLTPVVLLALFHNGQVLL